MLKYKGNNNENLLKNHGKKGLLLSFSSLCYLLPVICSESFNLFPEQHILVTAQAAGEHSALTFMDGFPELVGAVSVINILERLFLNIAKNVIGIIGAKMYVAVVVDIGLAPGNNAMVAHRDFKIRVIGMGFFRI